MLKRTALLATCGIAALVTTQPATGLASGIKPPYILDQLILDLDRDGLADLASLVLVNPQGDSAANMPDSEPFVLSDGDSVNLEIRLGRAGKPADLSRPADLVKAGIIDTTRRAWAMPLEADDLGRLVIASASGPGSSHDVQQSMTITVRSGQWIVAGFSEFWEMNDWKGDVVETDIGGCTIDYESGTATINTSLDDTEKLAGTFKPVALADWTDALRPPACRY